METITILKLKIKSNHTIEWHGYYLCTYLYIISLVWTFQAWSSIYV